MFPSCASAGDVCDLPVWVPTDWTHLVECCLARDPADRPTLAQALATLTLIKNSPPTYAPYGCSSAAISSTTVDQLYIDSTRDRSTGKVRADDSQSNVDLIPARVQGSGRSFSWDETDSDSPSAGEQDLRSSATLRLTKSDSFPFSGQLKGMADYGSVTEIQPVGSGALDLIPTEPAMLAAARSVAGELL